MLGWLVNDTFERIWKEMISMSKLDNFPIFALVSRQPAVAQAHALLRSASNQSEPLSGVCNVTATVTCSNLAEFQTPCRVSKILGFQCDHNRTRDLWVSSQEL
jgi:hypothetical protein